MNAPHDNSLPAAGQSAAVFDTPPAAGGNDALAQLADKLQPLADSGRLDNIVDLLALASDLVDLLDAPMVEKLGALSEQATGAAWTLSNAWRAAQAQGLQEARPRAWADCSSSRATRTRGAGWRWCCGRCKAWAVRWAINGGTTPLPDAAGGRPRGPLLSKTKPRKRLPAGLWGCAPGMGDATGLTATCA